MKIANMQDIGELCKRLFQWQGQSHFGMAKAVFSIFQQKKSPEFSHVGAVVFFQKKVQIIGDISDNHGGNLRFALKNTQIFRAFYFYHLRRLAFEPVQSKVIAALAPHRNNSVAALAVSPAMIPMNMFFLSFYDFANALLCFQ